MKPNKKGTILITSLWILTILSILAIGIGFRVSIEVRLSKYSMDRLKALYLAKAGVAKSRQILLRCNNAYDSIGACGIILPPDKNLNDIFSEKLGDGAFAVNYDEEGVNHPGMLDEERKIDINRAPQDVLVRLLGTNSEDVAASIVNWRGTAQVPRGAWDDYYQSLNPPYECKHADFSVIEELMLVKGVTPELFESIKDYITVYGYDDGKININTATKKVMLAVGLSEKAADMIVGFRNGIDGLPGTKDDGIFLNTAQDIISWDLTPDEKFILGNYFTTRSNYFRIEARGAVDGSSVTSRVVCIVKRGAKKLEYYREY